MRTPSRRDALRLLGLAGLTSVAGCGSVGLGRGPNEHPPRSLGTSWSPPADAWCFPQADVQNTGRSSHDLQTRPTVEWQKQVGESQSLTDGELVAATPAHVITAGWVDHELRLRASDAADGAQAWQRRIQFPSGRRIPQFGGLVDDRLYVSDSGTDVLAVDAAEGTVRWRRSLYDRVADSVPEKFMPDSAADFSPLPFGTPETVYVQSSYGLHGLAPEDGTERWRLYLGSHADDSTLENPYGLAITDRRIWASYGGSVQSLFTVEMSEGSPTTERTRLPLGFPSTPVITGDGEAALTHDIVWGTSPQETLAIGVTDEVRWQFPGYAGEGAAAYSSLATDGERVFVCASYERPTQLVVFALRASTGKLDWLLHESLADRDVSIGDGGAFRLCQPAVTGDSLVVGYGSAPEATTGHGELLAVSRSSGRVRWRTSLPVAPRHVAKTSERLYVGGQRGSVVALAAAKSR